MSSEYEVSMRTGASVLRALDNLLYSKKDVVITKEGQWLDGGKHRSPEQALAGVDVVFIALHGEHGEDGRVQRYLSNHNIRYTGSRALASATALNKVFTKRLLRSHGIKTPEYKTFDSSTARQDDSFHTLYTLGERVVVKPAGSGSSVDAFIGVPMHEVSARVKDLLKKYETVLVEEMIDGKEVTVGVLEQFRDQPLFALPVVEIVPPPAHDFYSYEAKYGGEASLICPGAISDSEQRDLHDIATQVHQLLDLRHYSRSDFILRDGQPYFLEVNTLPGLTEHSLFPRSLSAAGATYDELVEHLVNQAHY